MFEEKVGAGISQHKNKNKLHVKLMNSFQNVFFMFFIEN